VKGAFDIGEGVGLSPGHSATGFAGDSLDHAQQSHKCPPQRAATAIDQPASGYDQSFIIPRDRPSPRCTPTKGNLLLAAWQPVQLPIKRFGLNPTQV